MKDLEKCINRRKRCDAEFAEDFEAGYPNFKVGVLLKQAREGTGMTQDEMERKSNTKKSAKSRDRESRRGYKLIDDSEVWKSVRKAS